MFIGEYNHSVDTKGRMNVPAKFRDDLGERFYMTKGLDNCLFMFPEAEWRVFEEKLKPFHLQIEMHVHLFVCFLQVRQSAP